MNGKVGVSALGIDPQGNIIVTGTSSGPDWSVFTTIKYVETSTVSVEERAPDLPSKYYLSANYPNPFNPETKITYRLPGDSEVSLKIYNTLGQLVRTLVDKKQLAGNYSVRWEGKDQQGISVGSGVYFYKLQAGDFVQVRKMALVR